MTQSVETRRSRRIPDLMALNSKAPLVAVDQKKLLRKKEVLMDLVISIAMFFSILCIIAGILLLLKNRQDDASDRVREQLRILSKKTERNSNPDILRRRRKLSDIPWLDKVFLDILFLRKIDRILQQSNIQYPLSIFILSSFLLAFIGYYITLQITGDYLISIPAPGVMGVIPFLYIFLKKRLRMKKFERQLPDALDLVARSLRVGHTFSAGLQMIAQEFEDPIKTEFAAVIDEINFGAGIKEALKNLTERVDCAELGFFAVAVSIQRETGGDLAEILENIAYLIRERFKLQGRIAALSAEGKLSAMILIGLPIFIAISLSVINPEYIKILVTDSIGKMLVGVSIGMMFLSILIMKKIVTIKI